VAERLGDLPLALDLAGRYLYYHSLTPLDYLDRISKTALKHRSLKSNNIGSPTRHDTDVELTFVLSWEQLGNDDVDVLAKRFFIASGYLAPNVPIPHDIFYWLSHTNDREIYQEKTDDALLRLRQLGLLTDTLSLHPLLAEFARAKVIDLAVLTDISDQMSRLSKNALATGVPSDFYPLRPHIEVLAFHAERAELLEAGMLWNNLGYHYWMIPEYEKARVAHECALAIWEKQLGREHPQLATVINNLGLVLKDMGDLPSAKACFERAMMIWEKQFGRDHPNVASCANNLGSVLQALGDLLGAKNMLERALAIDEKIYGKEHPEIAMDVNNLGRVLRAMGDLLGAKTMYERALAINEKIYGKEYPDVSIDVNNLGMVLVDLGDLVGARIMYERGLAIDKKTYGNEHPEVAADFHNLAVVLVKMGDLPQALELEQHALAMFQKFLPAEHQDIENSRKWLAEIERRLKDGNR
jgi:tetratricopeptide (TPR) repeat protein